MTRSGERNSNTMTKNLYKIGMSMAFMPIFALPGTIDITSTTSATDIIDQNKVEISIEDERQVKADKIAKYYGDRSMPLSDKAMDFVLAAEKYDLDWRLLPAIAVRESSGGKNACYNNPFGWGSCKIKFSSHEEAIETLAKNLGGANPRTAYYYKDKTTLEKLYYYNGTVVPTYPKEVVKIMDRIGGVELD
ncbi:MAG: hypothetical protein QG614_399 [Patescibacteria group bacterium]|nr:hypothetical protein [Patescibacteria group bacterium]